MVNGEVQNKDPKEVLGDINWGETVRKNISTCLPTPNFPLLTIHLPLMSWTSISSSQKPRSNCNWRWKCNIQNSLWCWEEQAAAAWIAELSWIVALDKSAVEEVSRLVVEIVSGKRVAGKMAVEAVERIPNKQIQVSSFNYFVFHQKLTLSIFSSLSWR